MMRRPRLPRTLSFLLTLPLLSGCGPAPDSAEGIVEAAIARHGGALFEEGRIRFEFRGTAFESWRDGGVFRYERRYRDPMGRLVSEVMDNGGTRREVDGVEALLTPEEQAEVETQLNSVIYFGFLPFRLRDPSVRLRKLDPEEVQGELYDRIEVTFAQEGGGADHDARFIHWIHQEDRTLDYFAYAYSRDGGGERFRRAVNRREVGGLLVQDFENYGPGDAVGGIETFAAHFTAGDLALLSLVALEGVEVWDAGTAVPPLDGSSPSATDDGTDGLEVQLGIDRLSYAPGDPVRVLLALVNRAEAERRLTFPTAQRYDLILLDADGGELLRWSQDRSFAQVVGEERLPPGQTLSFEETLLAPGRPGSYVLQGRIAGEAGGLQAALPFDVAP